MFHQSAMFRVNKILSLTAKPTTERIDLINTFVISEKNNKQIHSIEALFQNMSFLRPFCFTDNSKENNSKNFKYSSEHVDTPSFRWISTVT